MEKIITNKEGLVSLGSLLDIYTFIHDIEEPCHHFDNQLPICISNKQDNQIIFTKKYTYGKISTTLQHHIQKTDRGFVWEITRKVATDELHHCRFGITIPLGTFNIKDKNGSILTPIVNYQQQWQPKYADQTNIDLPILQLEKSEPMIICMPIADNVQFFKFKENNVEYLKISTKFGDELKITIHFLFNAGDDLKQIYCDIFPESKNYVYQSELLKRKIHSKYNIRILSHEIFHRSGYITYPPTIDELETYMELLEENLSFYPSKVFGYIGLKNISICGYLVNELELIKGYSEAGGMLLNASEKLAYSLKCRTIHHEMFHMIEGTVIRNDEVKTAWNKLPPYDSFTEHFKEVRAITHPNEYRCELFSTFVLDPRFVRQLAEKDLIVRHKFDIVKSIFGKLSPECDQIIRNHNQKIENSLIPIYENSQKITLITPMDRQLIAVKHSCSPEVLKIFKNTTDILIVDDPSKVPQQVDIAYITINPLDFCAIEYTKYQIPVEDSFNQWVAMHIELEGGKSAIHLKSEDILRYNIPVVKGFLEGVGDFLNVDNLWNINEEIRPYHLDSIPFLKKIWNLFRNTPIIVRMGYSDVSYEE